MRQALCAPRVLERIGTYFDFLGLQVIENMVARDGIEPPLGSENRQVIDSVWTQKAQNTTKAGLEVHRRYTEKLLSCILSPTRHAMRIAENESTESKIPSSPLTIIRILFLALPRRFHLFSGVRVSAWSWDGPPVQLRRSEADAIFLST